MTETLDDYLPVIGRVTTATSELEEQVIVWSALLSNAETNETHGDRLLKGLDRNLNHLKECVVRRASVSGQQKALAAIEKARHLKNQRNTIVHGVWQQMENADTGELCGVKRSRYRLDRGSREAVWDLSTPSVNEVEKLADALKSVTLELSDAMGNLWDHDPAVRTWRSQRGFD
jgi:hypothetical protein